MDGTISTKGWAILSFVYAHVSKMAFALKFGHDHFFPYPS
jgi:hypothetical protein